MVEDREQGLVQATVRLLLEIEKAIMVSVIRKRSESIGGFAILRFV